MSNNCKKVYEHKAEEVFLLIDILKKELTRHNNGNISWGKVGDIEKTRNDLIEMIKFIRTYRNNVKNKDKDGRYIWMPDIDNSGYFECRNGESILYSEYGISGHKGVYNWCVTKNNIAITERNMNEQDARKEAEKRQMCEDKINSMIQERK